MDSNLALMGMGNTHFVALYRVTDFVKNKWGALTLLHHTVSDIVMTNGVIPAEPAPLTVPSTKWDKFGAFVHGHFVSAPFPSEEADNPDGLS